MHFFAQVLVERKVVKYNSMDDLLKSFMEQAEEAGLSEGDYLKTCDALKKTFVMVNSTDNKETSYDMQFKFEFKCKLGYTLSLDITKAIRIAGPFANRIKYTLLVRKPGVMNAIIKEEVNVTCKYHKIASMIKVICNTYLFDTFTITNSVGCIEYNVKKVLEMLNDKYMHFNSLPEDDDDEHEREFQLLTKNEHAYFIAGIFNQCYEESLDN